MLTRTPVLLYFSENRLRQKNSSLGKEEVTKAAHSIERLLFLQLEREGFQGDATDITSHLKDRLETLLHRLLHRKAVAAKVKTPKELRQEALRQSLGEERYTTVMSLVREIQRLRLDHTSEGCASCRRKRGQEVCRMSANGTTLPPPVHDLFFNVPLVYNAENCLTNSTVQQWDQWAEEANTVIDGFLAWRNAGRPHPNPVLESFQKFRDEP